jgi:hypothetical protein
MKLATERMLPAENAIVLVVVSIVPLPTSTRARTRTIGVAPVVGVFAMVSVPGAAL